MKTIILSLLLVLSTGLAAADIVTIDNVNYSLDGAEARVEQSPNARGSVVIPAEIQAGGVTYPVTEIADSAFFNLYEVTDVILPKSITQIGALAFYNSSIPHPIFTKTIFAYLPSDYAGEYTVPRTVREIAGGAFCNCGDLTAVNLPKDCKRIGARAFLASGINYPIYTATEFIYMPMLYSGSYVIPDGITEIMDCAFYGVDSLTRITIPASVNRIGHHAFFRCLNLDSVVVPEQVSEIEPYAFAECERLITLTLPSRLGQIGDYAFYNCKWLSRFDLGRSQIGAIGDYAFYGCVALQSANMREGLLSIGERAFNQCNDLREVTIPQSVESAGREAFEHTKITTPLYSKTLFIRLPESVTGTYTVPDGIVEILPRAFQFTQALDAVVLPASVRTIGEEAFQYSAIRTINLAEGLSIGRDAFVGCRNLNK